MFEISALKEMKLSELQEIAKSAKTIKFNDNVFHFRLPLLRRGLGRGTKKPELTFGFPSH